MLQSLVFGGVSGMIATTCIQPIDFVKVQVQIRSEMGEKNPNPIEIARKRIKEKGLLSLYRGLDSALMRQLVYTSIRFGLFYDIKDRIKKSKGREANVFENTIASLTSGGIGSLAGNPFDVALVRMQADNNLPEKEKRNYKNVFDALSRIVREEGIAALWRGCLPTVARAMAMNFAMMTSFEEAKKIIGKYTKNNRLNSVLSSCVAGFCGAFLSLPFDNTKTKIQRMKANAEGKMPYDGIIDCFKKSIKKEGFPKLWVGFSTFYVRVAPHAIISLLINEFLRNTFTKKK